MIAPNKAVTLQESALGLAAVVLEQGPHPIGLMDLYQDVSDRFESIDLFLLTIDLLYVVGRIDVDFESRTLTYVN